jgi:hypothetical protein
MIKTGFENRVKVQQIIQNQLPEFILDESPKTIDFLKQYYISQEYQGGPIDISDNLDQYLNLDNLTPEVIQGSTTLSYNISEAVGIVTVSSTKGFPSKYGLLKIDDEIITYTGITTNTFTGCIRGFSGITNYHKDLEYEELVFSSTSSSSHFAESEVENLSVLFLQEFYKKLKYTLAPGLENIDFVSNLNVGTFLKNARSFYQSKGTKESFRILFNILYGVNPKIIDLENFLIKPSDAKYIRREVILVEQITGNPLRLIGQTLKSKQSDDLSASISEVEIVTRGGKSYYKFFIFVGYDDTQTTSFSNFTITPNTKCIDKILSGDTVITVDSTLGFPDSGILYANDQKINYSSKSINQFFGCYTIGYNAILSDIDKTTPIISDYTYYGYENGDTSKEVVVRITGVLSNFKIDSTDYSLVTGDVITVKSLGDNISPNQSGKNATYKQINANSWIYNTSSRYQLDSFSESFAFTKSSVHKSSLKVNDYVEFLQRNTEIPVAGLDNVRITNIIDNKKVFFDTNISSLNSRKKYDIRRKVKKSNSTLVPIGIGTINLNNKVFSDVQNVYSDGDEYLYVASNSLPSYEINSDIFEYVVSSIPNSGLNNSTGKYSILEFSDYISFLTGDEVYYSFSDQPISGLSEGKYYVKLLSNRQLQLFSARNFIDTNKYLEFSNVLPTGNHTFTLLSQKEKIISPQKILKKIKLNPEISDKIGDDTLPGSSGILINGVEIFNYKSNDKIYYGPLEKVRVLNSGSDYDVINPPKIEISGNALVQPIVQGSITSVYVDPQEFDIDVFITISVTGGNGSDVSLKPIIVKNRREIEFDARQTTRGGGIDVVNERITFLNNHNLFTGQEIIYDTNGNDEIGIGSFRGVNYDQGNLVDNAIYYAKVLNDRTIQIHQTKSDAITGVNTVGFTTIGTSGIQKFKTSIRNTLSEIKVLNGGNGFTNRELIVKSSGISTSKHTINFKNHGFLTGEIITYTYTSSPVVGLSSENSYYVGKLTDDSFRLYNAGIGVTISENYEKNNYVKFSSTGSGYQIFNYPEIAVVANYSGIGIGSTQIRGNIVCTPTVRGEIVDAYVYETGSNYGSTILNYHKKPTIKIKTGTTAQLKPVISNGKIIKVLVLFGGSNYDSTPDLEVFGDGTGAVLRAITSNGKINSVKIINSGFGYLDTSTSILVKRPGKNAVFDGVVRSLSVNKSYQYGVQDALYRESANEIIVKSTDNLQYFVCGYSENLKNNFNEVSNKHSPIIGWAYDGNPIYGPYGYSDPYNSSSPLKLIKTGYATTDVSNRPSGFDLGFFNEDYIFNNSGDLDSHNGRFCKTPEFPNGVYAYFASTKLNPSGELTGEFPYFIGKNYRSQFVTDNIFLNQYTYDLNNSGLIRNTFPYRVDDEYSGNDFITESNELINQTTVIESVTPGEVTSFEVIESGSGYKVGDKLIFDQDGTSGYGVDAAVSEISGGQIANINTTKVTYSNAVIERKNSDELMITIKPYHNLNSGDIVSISGLSTNLFSLNGFYKVGFNTQTSYILKDVPAPAVTGVVTFISLPNIPDSVSIGSSIKVDNEIFSILDIYKTNGALKVLRTGAGVSHSQRAPIYFFPDSFTIYKKTDGFDSKNNVKVFFNPRNTLGVGTTPGEGNNKSYFIDGVQYYTYNTTQSIFVPNHPFKTGEKVIVTKPSGTSAITVSTSPDSGAYGILVGASEILYIINKSKDYIGLVTSVGVTTNTSGLFFPVAGGSNNELYSIESDKNQIKCDVNKLEATVSISSSHLLNNNDIINLQIKPNLKVGIGTTANILLRYNNTYKKLLIDKVIFDSSSVNTTNSTIGITSHYYKTGDSVFYDSGDTVASGLSTGKYFICKIDDNIVKLSETYYDCFLDTPKTVSITSTGGDLQELSLINPKLKSIKNNKIIFNVSDSSLLGYNFNLYYDREFKNKFEINLTNGSNVILGFGTVGNPGIGTISTRIVNYSTVGFPERLYYNFEKDGTPLEIDNDVADFCQISFVDSTYNGQHDVYGVGNTTFKISLDQTPEKLNYYQEDCDLLKYSTKSKTANGPVEKIKIISSGGGYKKLPIYIGSLSKNGDGAYILPKSSSIGKLNRFRIVNEGFEYASDKTISPSANIPKVISITSSSSLKSISVLDGGKNYTSAPNLVTVNSITGEKINSGVLIPKLIGNSISSVEIREIPRGLPFKKVRIMAISNTNGIKIDEVQSSVSGIGTLIISTPIAGFSTDPFITGDEIYVEGVTNHNPGDGNIGYGFNSENHGYQFFKVTRYYQQSNPGKLEFQIPKLYGNPGLAKTIQDSFASVIKSTNYPKFSVEQELSVFLDSEKIYSSINGFPFEKRDLYVSSSNGNYVRLIGKYELTTGEIIKGEYSSTVATVSEIKNVDGMFEINFSKNEKIGWLDDTGKTNLETQVIQNNDYYQSLSYTIKSPKEWDQIVTPVNNLVHPSGFKNFADTEITQNAESGIATASQIPFSIIKDFITESDVTTINNIDFAVDIEPLLDSTNVVKFKNIKLADYVECRTNRVLQIDDISPLFSSIEDEKNKTFSIILPLELTKKLTKALIQVIKTDYSEIQLSEIVVINTQNNVYTLQKANLSNKGSKIATISGVIDSFNTFYLQFEPDDIFNSDYEIKILKTEFNTPLTGISTQSIGFNKLTASNKLVNPGVTTSVVSFNSSQVKSFYTSIQVYNTLTNEMNYVEFYITHDGTDTYMSEFYFDDKNDNLGNYIGSFGVSLSNQIISLNLTNTYTGLNKLRFSSKTVGFGSTSAGIGTYRFKYPKQRDGSEQTALYESKYVLSSTNTDIISVDSNRISSLKSTVRVGYGKTTALHQLLMVYDGSNVITTQYPFLSIGSTSGIGTFGGYLSGSNLRLRFYPDTSTNNADLEILMFNEVFYKGFDEINIPPKLFYSPITEAFSIAKYFGTNSQRTNRLNFDLNYNGYPIFKKSFDPEDSTILDPTNHIFTIENHFFSTGEELYYRPKSTFIGVGTAPIGIGTTLSYSGITTNKLPDVVYPIKINNSQFRLATRKEYAQAGIYVTFTSFGEGNAHELEMVKKNEKSFITIANLTQYPLAWTKNKQTLSGNPGSLIGIGNTIISLSGISTVNITDILRVDNEYMKVTNVGFGTTNIGPITFSGNVPLVEVVRGFCGTAATSHTDGSIARIYKGSYNISGNEIFFTDPPRGNIFDLVGLNESNLTRERAKFSGRVFLRKDYTRNTVYDNISESFTGIGRTHTLTVQGINTVGLGTTAGNGLVFINSIFQTPTTENATISNFEIIEDFSAGITSIRFSGITSSNGSQIVSNYDQNQNQLPRGGLIVSLGSTPGLGYAPLVGASFKPIINGSGSIVGFGTTSIFGSGYRGSVSIAVTESGHSGTPAVITATVGAGGTLSLNIVNGGTDYTNPAIIIPSPSYENLPIIGISRLSVGSTTETGTGLLMNLEMGPSSRTGIGSTLFEVSSFKITRSGFNFQIGDVFTPVGLVTAKGLNQPLEQFKVTVVEIFNDSFGAIQLGEMNYIDSIRNLQDGRRTRFPLYYNSELLSFESNRDDPDSSLIDFDSLLVIFINGILQEPKKAYNFNGGTTFNFLTAPKKEDNVSIFFYVGTRDEDSVRISVDQRIKEGDTIQIYSDNNNLQNTITQDSRTVNVISGSDRIETNIYRGEGIDPINFKPLNWTKQKRDILINETIVSKARDSIESQVYPTSKVIKNFGTTDSNLFVDNAEFFDYEEGLPVDNFDCLIVNDQNTLVSAAITATVSIAGTISSLTIVDSGEGYSGASIIVKISPPKKIGVGVGTTATASIAISNGKLVGPITITNPGYGYTITSPPQVLVPSPQVDSELIKGISIVQGFDGVITGIATTSGLNGASLALSFTIVRDPAVYTDLEIGYPIFVNSTRVGNGITSIDNDNAQIIGIGTQFLDNIYYIHGINKTLGIITCNISSSSSVVGIATTGTLNYPVGRFSWGRFAGFSRSSNPISIAVTGKTIDVGLTTFSSVQRRNYGLRNTGSLKKRVMGL